MGPGSRSLEGTPHGRTVEHIPARCARAERRALPGVCPSPAAEAPRHPRFHAGFHAEGPARGRREQQRPEVHAGQGPAEGAREPPAPYSVPQAQKRSQTLADAPPVPQVYGSAYLITSISLSVVSFTLSYVLVSAGVDVAGLLEKARARLPAPGGAATAADARCPARRLASPSTPPASRSAHLRSHTQCTRRRRQSAFRRLSLSLRSLRSGWARRSRHERM